MCLECWKRERLPVSDPSITDFPSAGKSAKRLFIFGDSHDYIFFLTLKNIYTGVYYTPVQMANVLKYASNLCIFKRIFPGGKTQSELTEWGKQNKTLA